MSTAIQIEAGPETLKAIAALTEQLSILNAHFMAQTPATHAPTADEDWLTMQEFSKLYKISPNTVYARVKEGRVERMELGARSPRYRLAAAN